MTIITVASNSSRNHFSSEKYKTVLSYKGDRGGTVVKVLRYKSSLVRSQLVSQEFFIDIKSFRSHYGPGVDSASNRNEYQEHFLGVKAAGP